MFPDIGSKSPSPSSSVGAEGVDLTEKNKNIQRDLMEYPCALLDKVLSGGPKNTIGTMEPTSELKILRNAYKHIVKEGQMAYTCSLIKSAKKNQELSLNLALHYLFSEMPESDRKNSLIDELRRRSEYYDSSNSYDNSYRVDFKGDDATSMVGESPEEINREMDIMLRGMIGDFLAVLMGPENEQPYDLWVEDRVKESKLRIKNKE